MTWKTVCRRVLQVINRTGKNVFDQISKHQGAKVENTTRSGIFSNLEAMKNIGLMIPTDREITDQESLVAAFH